MQAPGEAESASDPAVGKAKELFDRGQSLYQTADYQGAVEAFTSAFIEAKRIKDENLHYVVHTALLFNLARAHIKAYKTDLEAAHLRKSIELLDSYLALELEDSDRKEAEDFRTEAVETLAALDEKAAREEAAKREQAQAAQDDPGGSTRDETTTDEPTRQRDDDGSKAGKTLTAAGYASLGVGAAGLGVLGAGLAISAGAQDDYEKGPDNATRTDAESRGATGNTLSYVGAGIGAVGVITGIALIVVGTKKKKAEASARTPTVSPFGGVTGGGVVLHGRF